jgi:hypothetical protein
MQVNVVVLRIAALAIAPIAFTASYAAAATPVDATLTHALRKYTPTPADLGYNIPSPGNLAIVNVGVSGTALQYTGVVLDGDGVNANGAFPFLKVQQQNSDGNFEYGACYLGNNGAAGSFGLGFFALSQPFKTAVMVGARQGSNVVILLKKVNGGALADQKYVCSGAPAPPGASIGVVGYADNTSRLDNFRSCPTSVLDTFSYTGTLGSTGNWNDAAPGMHANGMQAIGGPLALSFWTQPLPSCP